MEQALNPFIIGGIVMISILVLSLIIGVSIKNYYKGIELSYSKFSDKDLLLFINEQPDKIVDAELIARKFNTSKSKVSARLRPLHYKGVLSILYNRMMTKGHYTLSRPIEKSYDLSLSEDPFMTLEDLLKIFKHYDYQVSLQEMILVTGLPIKVIEREMKYFEKEKIVKLMLKMESQHVYQRIYTLNEPYRSNPDAFLKLDNVNFKLKEIYEKVARTDYV